MKLSGKERQEMFDKLKKEGTTATRVIIMLSMEKASETANAICGISITKYREEERAEISIHKTTCAGFTGITLYEDEWQKLKPKIDELLLRSKTTGKLKE